jgi:hypothetical protein
MHSEKQRKMIISSLAERLIFTQFHKQRNDFEILEMSKVIDNKRWDVKILSGGTQYLIEVKIRHTPKKRYPTWTIQKDKYSFLVKESEVSGYTPTYINFHLDGCQFWNLSETPAPEWGERLYPEDSQTGYDKLILKQSADLLSPDATQYNYAYDIEQIYDEAEKLYNDKYTKIKLK